MSSQYPVTMVSNPSASPPVGFSPGNITLPMKMRGTAAVAGEVFHSDLFGGGVTGDSETPTGGAASLGLETSIWSNMITPTAVGVTVDVSPIFGIAKRNIADLGVGEFITYGFANAFVAASTSITGILGNTLRCAGTVKSLVGDGGVESQTRYVAILQASTALTTSAVLAEVFINGIGHVGYSWPGASS